MPCLPWSGGRVLGPSRPSGEQALCTCLFPHSCSPLVGGAWTPVNQPACGPWCTTSQHKRAFLFLFGFVQLYKSVWCRERESGACMSAAGFWKLLLEGFCYVVKLSKLLLVKYIELVDNQFRVFCNRKTEGMFTWQRCSKNTKVFQAPQNITIL